MGLLRRWQAWASMAAYIATSIAWDPVHDDFFSWRHWAGTFSFWTAVELGRSLGREDWVRWFRESLHAHKQ